MTRRFRALLRRRLTATPLPLTGLAGLAVVFVAAPFVGLALRVQGAAFLDQLHAPQVRTALLLSLQAAAGASALSVLFGVPLAWMLSRHHGAIGKTVRALVTVPMVLPPVVAGAMMLFALGLTGWLGQYLARAGIVLPYTTAGVIAVQTFVALPQMVVTAEAAFRALDPRYGEAAATCGAAPWTVFWLVILPLARTGLVAATLMAWAKALGEFGATITFAGNLPGHTQTMPLAISLALENDPAAAVVMSVVLVLTSVGAVLGVNLATRSRP
jgi:molybdate transport system permease protein